VKLPNSHTAALSRSTKNVILLV